MMKIMKKKLNKFKMIKISHRMKNFKKQEKQIEYKLKSMTKTKLLTYMVWSRKP